VRDDAASRSAPSVRLSLAALGKLVDALLHIPEFQRQDGRDHVLALLQQDVSTVIPRQPAARMDVISIVRTCSRYPGALRELTEAIRFYAKGSAAMAQLDAVIAEVCADGMEPR
jgi:hypothetical protein